MEEELGQENYMKSPLIKFTKKKHALVKSSFFDDYVSDEEYEEKVQSSSQRLWLTEQEFKLEISQKENCDEIIIEGNLMYHNKDYQLKTGYFVCYNNRLVKYQDQTKKVIKSMFPFQNTKIDFIEQIKHNEAKALAQDKQLNFCFFITRNKKFEILYAENSQDYNLWQLVLKKFLIQTYFIRNYTTQKIIGQGTFAKVAQVEKINTKELYAVKIFDKKSLLTSKNPSRTKVALLNEISIMKQLNNPNIIQLHEIYEGDFHIYLVVDLLTGGELFDRIIEHDHFDEPGSFKIFYQLLKTIDYMHSKGIMHRDIKPENLIMKQKDELTIRICDFGLAEKIHKKNRIFQKCGTPGYVAPEILLDKEYDEKCDMFSCGVILYILLTGCTVFNGDSYEEIINKNKNCIINWKFEKINIHISDACKNLLRGLLEPDPSKRLSSKEALQHGWILQHKGQQGTFSSLEEIAQEQIQGQQVHQNLVKLHQTAQISLTDRQKMDLITQTPLITGKNEAISNFVQDQFQTPMMTPATNLKELQDIKQQQLQQNMSKFNKYLDNNYKDENKDAPKDQKKVSQKVVQAMKNLKLI